MRATGLAVAGFVAVSTPLTFTLVSLRAIEADQRETARASADKTARYVFQHEWLWELQRDRLREVIKLAEHDQAHYAQSIVTATGTDAYADDIALPAPILTIRAPIVVLDRIVGDVVVRSSLRRFLLESAAITAVSLTMAALAYWVFLHWPMRQIDRIFAALRDEQKRTQDALEELRVVDAKLWQRTDQLHTAQELGKIGDWRMAPDGADLTLSPVAVKFLGLETEWIKPTLSDFKARVLGSGAAAIDRVVSDVIRTRQDQSIDFDFCCGDDRIARLALTCHADGHTNGHGADLRAITGTIQDLSERYEAQIQLEKLAFFDPLTGLANRAMFTRKLNEICEPMARAATSATLLLMDLDRFKEVNDSLGHAAGDELLAVIARMLNSLVKGPHFIARLGGDEFAIIIQGGRPATVAEPLALTIIEALGRPLQLTLGEVQIGVSIGIVLMPEDGSAPSEIIKHADLALYRAKENGRGRYARFEPAMSDIVNQKLALARDLRIALARNVDLEVWFQPQVALDDGRIIGFEALTRWRHPTRGFVPPDEFIPIAESSSLIGDLGHWMFLQSARSAMAWLAAGNPAYEVAVNLSAAQVWQTDVERDIASILDETGLPPGLLCLELTESLLADHTEGRVRRTLARLKALGVRLALDDFGTGYSSLSYLIQLPFDKLKIDRAFISGATSSLKKRKVLEGIIGLGHGIGMSVIAEGVETDDELALLRNAGCDQIQGYLIARPAPAGQAIAFARDWNTRVAAKVA